MYAMRDACMQVTWYGTHQRDCLAAAALHIRMDSKQRLHSSQLLLSLRGFAQSNLPIQSRSQHGGF
jgi:hypothetical protein